jgi:hypothetical protein
VAFRLGLPEGARAGWTVVVDPEGAVAEVYEGNNVAVVP